MTADVSTPSADYLAMKGYWSTVADVIGGTDTMRLAFRKYIHKFPHESESDYKYRQDTAEFTNIFQDIIEDLAARPFAQELKINEDADSRFADIVENVDAKGTHIHGFAADVMYHGLSNTLHWVFVDFTKTNGTLRSIADEKRAGVRPYWLSINALDMIDVDTANINGEEKFTHCRFKSNRVTKDGYEEKVIERIFEYNRDEIVDGDGFPTGIWSKPYGMVWEKSADNKGNSAWVKVKDITLTIDEIPLVPFCIGHKKGNSFVVTPILKSAIDVQIKLFRQESGLKYSEETTAHAMLTGNGVTPQVDKNNKPLPVPVGPKAALYAPMGADGKHGEWKYIEPTAANLKFLADGIEKTKQDLRELGRQPLTAQTGNLTVVTTTFAAQKGNSAVSAAALLLKDVLENCLRLTGKWLNITEIPEITIFTDFDAVINGESDMTSLIEMRKNGDISQETLWNEAQRRKKLSENFSIKDEQKRLNDELPGAPSQDDQLASLPPLKVV